MSALRIATLALSLQTLGAENPWLVGCSLERLYIYLFQLTHLLSQKQLLIPKPVYASYTCFCNYVIQYNTNKPIRYDCERELFYETKLNALKNSVKTDCY